MSSRPAWGLLVWGSREPSVARLRAYAARGRARWDTAAGDRLVRVRVRVGVRGTNIVSLATVSPPYCGYTYYGAWPRVEVLRCAGPLDLDDPEDLEGALVVRHDDPHRLPEGTCGSSAVMESEAVGRAGG